MRLFIDDERLPLLVEAHLWRVVRSPVEAIEALIENAELITHLSFDNDLQHPTEGRHILKQILMTPTGCGIVLPELQELRVHSANVPAAEAMLSMARAGVRNGALPPGVRVSLRSALHEAYPIDPEIASDHTDE
ncbi:MAG: cyclic-phosphate processing receiver domain-containing protein [Nitratireductor sp.]